MKPFIRLETPVYKNIPDKAETRAFEEYMDTRVELAESLGNCYIGQKFFPREDPDDLAQVFEERLAASCARQTKLTYSVGEDNPIKMTESDIRREMSAVIREHLKRTNGNIGHFPYSGERVVKRWVSTDKNDNSTYDVRLDPFSLFWAEATLGGVQGAAEKNKPREVEEDDEDDEDEENKTSRSAANYKLLFLVSVVLSAAALLGTLAVKRAGNVWLLLMVSGALLACLGLAGVSLILMIVDLVKRRRSAAAACQKIPEERFQTHFAVWGIGVNRTVESYDQARFEREVQELHAYFTFLRLWSENTGRALSVYARVNIERFYEDIRPFVIEEKS